MFNKLSFPKMFDFVMTRKYFCTALDRYIPGKKKLWCSWEIWRSLTYTTLTVLVESLGRCAPTGAPRYSRRADNEGSHHLEKPAPSGNLGSVRFGPKRKDGELPLGWELGKKRKGKYIFKSNLLWAGLGTLVGKHLHMQSWYARVKRTMEVGNGRPNSISVWGTAYSILKRDVQFCS